MTLSDEAVERLELKLAFLERANQELSDVVYRQQQEIDALRLQIRELIDRIEGTATSLRSTRRNRNVRRTTERFCSSLPPARK